MFIPGTVIGAFLVSSQTKKLMKYLNQGAMSGRVNEHISDAELSLEKSSDSNNDCVANFLLSAWSDNGTSN